MTSTYIFNILGYLAIGKILIIATSNLLLATINSFFRLQLCVKKEKVKNCAKVSPSLSTEVNQIQSD